MKKVKQKEVLLKSCYGPEYQLESFKMIKEFVEVSNMDVNYNL